MGWIDLVKKLDLGRLSTRERVLVVLTGFVVLFAYVGYVMIPSLRTVKSLAAQKNSIKAEIAQGTAAVPLLRMRLQALRQQTEGREAGAEFTGKVGDLFPGGSRLSVLLEEMTRLARLRQIEFVSVRPDAVEDKGSYLQLTLQIDLKTRFRELRDYFLMLENLPRPVVVKEMKIETQTDLSPFILAHLTVTTYLGKE